jgi:hypothetical protein
MREERTMRNVKSHQEPMKPAYPRGGVPEEDPAATREAITAGAERPTQPDEESTAPPTERSRAEQQEQKHLRADEELVDDGEESAAAEQRPPADS